MKRPVQNSKQLCRKGDADPKSGNVGLERDGREARQVKECRNAVPIFIKKG